jgi:UDP-N-acetylglucosamine 2-epimerase (non-hydrolysing)
MIKTLFIFGTRPEAIKMAPIIKESEKHTDRIITKVCVTAQHREMLDQVLDFFKITPDYDLNLMKKDQTLFDITADSLKGLEKVFKDYRPDLIFVQGDTTTAFVGALSGFYEKIKVGHVEAGLRSHNKFSPYPEEVNRVLAGHLADLHFAPTERAAENLKEEGVTENIWVTGNTVIDALFLGLKIVKETAEDAYSRFFDFVDFSKRVILVTGHRRESFGEPFENICMAMKEIIDRHEDVEIVYPVHLNPNVRRPVNAILKDTNRIHLIEPLDYPHLIWLMNRSYLVLTDSGGIQEEAPSIGKPVLVMRDVTERVEGVQSCTAKLVGTDKNKIISELETLLTNKGEYDKMSKAVNPYGSGDSAKNIINIVLRTFK